MSFWKGLFGESKKEKSVFVVDVGSGSIGVAFVRIEHGLAPEVLATARKTIPFQERLNVQRFVVLMQDTLDAATDVASASAPDFRPELAVIGLASPWNTSQTRLVHLDQDNDFAVTERGLRQILDKESDLFLSAPLESSGPKELLKNVLIESRAMQIKLNGYEVGAPIGRRAHDLDIALYLSMMPERINDAFRDAITRRWPHAEIHFHSFMLSAFSAIRDMFAESLSFIVVDVAGEVTDVALVRDNVLLESLSFPLGHNAFTRMVMREFGLQLDAAKTEVSSYMEGASGTERTRQMDEIFAKTKREWGMLFVGALQQLSEQHPIPRVIYQFVDEGFGSHYSDTMRESSERVFGQGQEDFVVHSLSEDHLGHFLSLQEGVHTDIFLCVIIMILRKLLEIDSAR